MVRAREVVTMMVPVSLLVLILLWKVLVGVGAGVAFWWVSEKPDPAVELDSACCVLLGLDVLITEPKKSI